RLLKIWRASQKLSTHPGVSLFPNFKTGKQYFRDAIKADAIAAAVAKMRGKRTQPWPTDLIRPV
ncbi:MAG: hypothetical protein IJF40_02645, partial [Clostridia bacterium]|nr:hypothetical protein [Clostridia bacterium]